MLRLRALTSSSEDDPNHGSVGDFDFEDRAYYTLRLQFYKQLRGCIKMLRKAAILCDRVLGQYLFRADIEEFRNSKILPHLLKAYNLQTGLFR